MLGKFGGFMPSAQRNVFLLGIIRCSAFGGSLNVAGLPAVLAGFGLAVWDAEQVFAFAQIAGYILSGFAAQRFGTRRMLQAAGAMLLLGNAIYAFGRGRSDVYLAEALIGFGQSFVFGKDETHMRTTLGGSGADGEFRRRWSGALGVECLFIGGCYLVGALAARWVPMSQYFFSCSVYGSLLIAASFLTEDVRSASGQPMTGAELIRGVARSLARNPRLCGCLFWYAFYGAMARVAFWGFAGYLVKSNGSCCIEVFLVGYCIVCAWLSERGGRSRASPQSVLLLSGISGASALGMGLFVTEWSYLLAAGIAVMRGYARPMLTAGIHEEIDRTAPELRASLATLKELLMFATYLCLLNGVRLFSPQSGSPVTYSLIGAGVLCSVGLYSAVAAVRARF